MKTFFRSFVEGFFVLLPILITYLMLGQLFDMTMALTQPILDVLPARLFPGEWSYKFAAAGILIVIIVLVGLASHTAIARRLGSWVESAILVRFPPYNILRSLATWISGKDAPDQLHPAMLSLSPDIRMVAAIVEELPDGKMTVFVPLAPTPGVGFLQIVNRSKVEKLDASMADALGWFLNWGGDTQKLFQQKNQSSSADPSHR
jgi:uncharacterized membrane protein